MAKKLLNIVLLKDVEKLGRAGDQAQVRLGYAKNYLIPRFLAVMATPGAINVGKKLIDARKKGEKKLLEELEKSVSKLEGIKLSFKEKVKKGTKELYGSIGEQEIIEKAEKKGVELKKKWIDLPKPLKKIGEHKIGIKLGHGKEVFIKIDIKAEKKEEK